MAAVNVYRAFSFMEELSHIHPDLEATFVESAKGGFIAGAGALVGGLLLGPPGILVGATAGGAAGMLYSSNFKPVWKIVGGMSPSEREKLAKAVASECTRLCVEYLTVSADRLSHDVGRELLKAVMKALGYSMKA